MKMTSQCSVICTAAFILQTELFLCLMKSQVKLFQSVTNVGTSMIMHFMVNFGLVKIKEKTSI